MEFIVLCVCVCAEQEKPEMDDFERKETFILKEKWIPLQKFHKIFLHILLFQNILSFFYLVKKRLADTDTMQVFFDLLQIFLVKTFFLNMYMYCMIIFFYAYVCTIYIVYCTYKHLYFFP